LLRKSVNGSVKCLIREAQVIKLKNLLRHHHRRSESFVKMLQYLPEGMTAMRRKARE